MVRFAHVQKIIISHKMVCPNNFASLSSMIKYNLAEATPQARVEASGGQRSSVAEHRPAISRVLGSNPAVYFGTRMTGSKERGAISTGSLRRKKGRLNCKCILLK